MFTDPKVVDMKVMMLKEVPLRRVIEVIEEDDNGNAVATGRFYRIVRHSSIGYYGKMPHQNREYSLLGTLLCRIITDPIDGL